MPKKLTIKELEQRINILAYNINSIKVYKINLNFINILFKLYIFVKRTIKFLVLKYQILI